jgi:hypothetical protein
MIIHCKYDIVFVQFLLCFLHVFFNNKACIWSIGFLQIVNISKFYHILGSNHSTFYVWSFQVSFPYKFLVLKMRTLLLTKFMWKNITFHCLPNSRCCIARFGVLFGTLQINFVIDMSYLSIFLCMALSML